jgi:hypothetical protein
MTTADIPRKAEWAEWVPVWGRYELRNGVLMDVVEINHIDRTVRLQRVLTGKQFTVSWALARDLLKHRVQIVPGNQELRQIARRHRSEARGGMRLVVRGLATAVVVLAIAIAGIRIMISAGVLR